MTREEMYNRVIELEDNIRKLEEMDKQDLMFQAIDEQLELAQALELEEL